jgi:hypothetical protein
MRMIKESKQIKDLKEIVGLTVHGVSEEYHSNELIIAFTNGSFLHMAIDPGYDDDSPSFDFSYYDANLLRDKIAVEAGLITEEQRKLNELQYQIAKNQKANKERRMLYLQLKAEFEEKEYATFTPDGASEDE